MNTSNSQAVHAQAPGIISTTATGSTFTATEQQPAASMGVGELLTKIYGDAPVVTYDPTWGNGTGYLNGAMQQRNIPLAIGDAVQFKDEFNRQAYVLGFGEAGNMVVFQRYASDPNTWVRQIGCVTKAFWDIIGTSAGLVKNADLLVLAKLHQDCKENGLEFTELYVPKPNRYESDDE